MGTSFQENKRTTFVTKLDNYSSTLDLSLLFVFMLLRSQYKGENVVHQSLDQCEFPISRHNLPTKMIYLALKLQPNMNEYMVCRMYIYRSETVKRICANFVRCYDICIAS